MLTIRENIELPWEIPRVQEENRSPKPEKRPQVDAETQNTKPRIWAMRAKNSLLIQSVGQPFTEHYYLPSTMFCGKQDIASSLMEFRLHWQRQIRKQAVMILEGKDSVLQEHNSGTSDPNVRFGQDFLDEMIPKQRSQE